MSSVRSVRWAPEDPSRWSRARWCGIMGSVKEKDQRRIKVSTQSGKLKKIKDWKTMIHPKLLEFVRSSMKVCEAEVLWCHDQLHL